MAAAVKNIVALRAKGIDTVSSRGSLIHHFVVPLPLLGEGYGRASSPPSNLKLFRGSEKYGRALSSAYKQTLSIYKVPLALSSLREA